ncbi:leucine-rich repeat-containing protein 45-like isoform X1 [Amphibalanus amphitrite]|uniref:leucine-rich repeat-containing protein 45-like isoform X1 n=1 Tax=Amphibalanus amphitrite TaxID=1232801 RepID=UPI001C8FCD13|nr:leucine-rich repeat-containing protein 45-like isoform X1 [Amphibalanus amphitrite]
MKNLEEKFKALCKEFDISPSKTLLEHLSIDDSCDGLLDFSSGDVTSEQAAVLGSLLSTSGDVKQLLLNDCLLSEDSLKALCLGLCLNTSVTQLELRGNNVRGPGTEHLATLLRKNRHLQTLTLEWNNLGLSPGSFKLFAEALRTNKSLKSLDLRSNQLDHQCAGHLARAVAGNRRLRHLDMRWNGIGVLGGRALVDALQANRTLVSCPVDGNALPPDLLHTIACRVRNNQELLESEEQKTAERSLLTAQIQDTERAGRREVEGVVRTLQTERASFSGLQADMNFQLGQLQEALDERKEAAERLASKLSAVEASLANTQAALTAAQQDKTELQEQVKTLQAELAAQKKANSEQLEHHKQVLERSRQEQEERSADQERRLTEERRGRLETERAAQEQRSRAEQLQQETLRLQATVGTLRDEIQAVSDREEQRRRAEAEAADELRRKEVAQVKEQAAVTCKNLQNQLRLGDEQRAALESQLQEASQRLYAASRETQDELAALRLRLKQQENDRCQALQAQIDHAHGQLSLVSQEKHELVTTNQRLQDKLRQAELENRSSKSEIECLMKELELKQREVQTAVARVRSDLQTELDRVEAEKTRHQQTEAALAETRTQLAQREEELERETRRRREEVRKLRDELKRRETEMIRHKQDELQRAAMLHSAFRNYFDASAPPRRRSGGARRESVAAAAEPTEEELPEDEL